MLTALNVCDRLAGGHSYALRKEDNPRGEICLGGMLVHHDIRSLYDALAFDYLFALMMAASGVLYLADSRFKERFTHLGLPSCSRVPSRRGCGSWNWPEGSKAKTIVIGFLCVSAGSYA